MGEYLNTLHAFTELISIDIKQYCKEAEAKCCSAEAMNLPDLCALAVKHAEEAEEIPHMLPSAISLGMVLVDCRSVKNMLSQKHKAIAASLFKVLELKIREFAETIITEFREMFNRLAVAPTSIEGIVELRDFMSGLPSRIDMLAGSIEKNEANFSLMESSKWQVSFEQMDMRWEVQ
jgi:dynein heavy chain